MKENKIGGIDENDHGSKEGNRVTNRAKIVVNKSKKRRKNRYSALEVTPELPRIDEMLNKEEEEDIGYEEADCINCRTRKNKGL